MHGEIIGYLGGPLHTQSGAPSVELKIVSLPQEEQNLLVFFQFNRIEALDIS
jgi:hypothetical protein